MLVYPTRLGVQAAIGSLRSSECLATMPVGEEPWQCHTRSRLWPPLAGLIRLPRTSAPFVKAKFPPEKPFAQHRLTLAHRLAGGGKRKGRRCPTHSTEGVRCLARGSASDHRMISRDDLKLWFSKYNLKGTGFHPIVKPVRIVIEHPIGVWRKLIKIVPYSSSDGGFGVMMPYHKANFGFLFKARVHDTTANLIALPEPNVIGTYEASSKVKMSFHPDGAVQFSSMNGRIISGRDSDTGAFKGLGIVSHPFTQPVRSGPTFGIVAWGLSEFETCNPIRDDIRFTIAEMANPYLRYVQNPAICFEAYMFPRSKPIASTPDFPDYRGLQNIWNPKLGTFGKREMRLIALNNNEAAIAIHVLKFPNVFSSPSGFQFGSPRDKAAFAIYATYPKEGGVSGLRSLDYAPSQAGPPQKSASPLLSIRQTVTIGPTRRFLLPDG
jgi:hypothetical protein